MRNMVIAAMLTLASVVLVSAIQISCGPGDDWPDGGDDYDGNSGSSCSDYSGACANYSGLPKCDGDLLIWCNNDNVVCEDCSEYDAGGALHCGVHPTEGAECMVSPGMFCDPNFPNGTGELCDGTCTSAGDCT